MARQLTPEQLAAYHRDGYVVVEDLVSAEELEALRERLREYTHGGRDPGAIDVQVEPRIQRGELAVEHPGDGIRKLTGLVDYDDRFHALGLHPNIVGIVQQVLGPDLKMFRNALLLKPPEVGSAKGMHQDSPYWSIEPMELCSCWFALDDATTENGCMEVLPGWHTRGPLPHIHVTDDFVVEPSAYAGTPPVTAPVRAGGGLFFHSLLPHYTAPNRSDHWRRAIALSYMSSRSRFTGEGEGPVYLPVSGETFPGCVR
jgi:ectoine hydroxylase-related dioxygenase (phytanoyl-CoA dioxygenase family)